VFEELDLGYAIQKLASMMCWVGSRFFVSDVELEFRLLANANCWASTPISHRMVSFSVFSQCTHSNVYESGENHESFFFSYTIHVACAAISDNVAPKHVVIIDLLREINIPMFSGVISNASWGITI